MRHKRKKRSRYSSGLHFYEDKRTLNLHAIREAVLWAITTVLAVFLAVACWRLFGFKVTVTGGGMEPGIVSQQSVLINRLAYQFSEPDRGDVIAFYPGGDENMHPSVKRVVAVPGDSVQIVDGVLLVNGVPSALQATYSSIEDAGTVSNMILLDDEEYFVLGDDPSESEDSRSAGIGTVEESAIIGEVWLALPSEEGSLHLVE